MRHRTGAPSGTLEVTFWEEWCKGGGGGGVAYLTAHCTAHRRVGSFELLMLSRSSSWIASAVSPVLPCTSPKEKGQLTSSSFLSLLHILTLRGRLRDRQGQVPPERGSTLYATARVETASCRVARVPGGSVERDPKRRCAMEMSDWNIWVLRWASCPMACSTRRRQQGHVSRGGGRGSFSGAMRIPAGAEDNEAGAEDRGTGHGRSRAARGFNEGHVCQGWDRPDTVNVVLPGT